MWVAPVLALEDLTPDLVLVKNQNMKNRISAEEMENFTNLVVGSSELLVKEAARLFKPHGLSPGQFNVLHLLVLRGGALRPSEIASSLVVDPASTTYVLDGMVRKGWLERRSDPEDRRSHHVLLTKEGRAQHDEVNAVYQEGLERLALALGGKQGLKESLELLQRLPEALRMFASADK